MVSIVKALIRSDEFSRFIIHAYSNGAVATVNDYEIMEDDE